MVQLGPTWHRRQILLPGMRNLGTQSNFKRKVKNIIPQLYLSIDVRNAMKKLILLNSEAIK
jgi:hypothetical protein